MAAFPENPLRSPEAYQAAYAESIRDPEAFWLKQAQALAWESLPTVANRSVFLPKPEIRWFEDGMLNACVNCVDRHAEQTPDKTAIFFEADEPGAGQRISYAELQNRVCKMANVLRFLGVSAGDIVTIYLPMVPELVYAMLACARIGAVHSVVFSGFSARALGARIQQAQSKLLITASGGARGGKWTPLKEKALQAISETETCVEKLLLIDGEKEEVTAPGGVHEFAYAPLAAAADSACPATMRNALDPLFVLYTSGSTGKPKGLVHGTGGYLTYAAITHRYIFDLQPEDVYFCTADIGWITGHTYGVYGPLANGATLVLFQGTPTYPTPARFWQIIDTHKVSLFYTAPTALRSLSKLDRGEVARASLDSLRILASVGEPIDPQTWHWFFEKVGHSRCPIMDTWWQTESGGVLICPLLVPQTQKASCAAKPFFGVRPSIRREQGEIIQPREKGALCIEQSWPGQSLGILGDAAYFQQSYFSLYPGSYLSGDNAFCDADGDFWILGRIDDVLNVSGHRLNSAEVEQAAMQHPLVAEVCVVGAPHEIKGQGIFIFAVPRAHVQVDGEKLAAEIRQQIRTSIGPIATPDGILLVADLPRTRSGKIVRRLLRKIASGDSVAHEDTSTLANPPCLAQIQQRWTDLYAEKASA